MISLSLDVMGMLVELVGWAGTLGISCWGSGTGSGRKTRSAMFVRFKGRWGTVSAGSSSREISSGSGGGAG